MRHYLISILLLICAVAGAKAPVDYVNPLIDTHKSRWFFFSSASRPFGMVSLSPDTQVKGSWNSGYLYDSLYVKCFSHIHAWQLAGIPVMPVTGDISEYKGMESCKSEFSHETEKVSPGYHKVFLDRYGVTAELTATCRVGMHRYRFPKGEKANVVFDVGAYLAHGPMLEAAVRTVSDNELRGYAVMAPTSRRVKPVKVYFVARFNTPYSKFVGWKTIEGSRKMLHEHDIKGKEAGGCVQFADLDGKPLILKVAISYVSEEQAQLNLDKELDHWNFDKVMKEARNEWNSELKKIRVKGGTDAEKIKFYTDLWHSLLGRHIFSDVNGKYLDNTGNTPCVRQVPLKDGKPVRNTYNSDAFWGAEFNLNILWSIAYPRIMSEFVSSMLDYYHNGGMIARGPSGGDYTFVMVGDQITPLVAAAYNKGIRDFDVTSAFEGCMKNSEPSGIRDFSGYGRKPLPYMENYISKGYVPDGFFPKGAHRGGCALTLYFAYEDWCMGQFAKALGKEDVYRKYDRRSSNYRNVFDKASGWMRPRLADGSWIKDFSPVGKGFSMPGFVESNSAIFTYYVPHDMAGLIELIGGNDTFVKKLERQFELASANNFIADHGKHSESWVDYENQPSLHLAHLFSHAGAPHLTQYWVRRIRNDVFGDITPYGGYNGDEDQGQMGALGVLMSIGLFDVQGGASAEPRYEITSPIFDKVTIRLDNEYYSGRKFRIVTKNNSPENIYIQSVRLNGKLWDGYTFPHEALAKGGVLKLEMGNTADL